MHSSCCTWHIGRGPNPAVKHVTACSILVHSFNLCHTFRAAFVAVNVLELFCVFPRDFGDANRLLVIGLLEVAEYSFEMIGFFG